MRGPQIWGFVTTLPYQWVQMKRERPYGLWYGMGKLLFDIYKYEHNAPQRNTDKSTYQKKKKKGTHKSKNVKRQSTFPKNHQQLFEPHAQWYPWKI